MYIICILTISSVISRVQVIDFPLTFSKPHSFFHLAFLNINVAYCYIYLQLERYQLTHSFVCKIIKIKLMFVNCPQVKIILGNLFRILKWNFLQNFLQKSVKDTIKKFQNTLVKANSKTPVANKVTSYTSWQKKIWSI